MDINEMLRYYNELGFNLKQLAEKYGMSKSTIQRLFVAEGYVYNKLLKKYVPSDNSNIVDIETNVSRETINDKTNVSRETIDTNNIVNRTYGIEKDVDKALKIMCAIEGKKPIDIVRQALRNAIDDKYFDM